MRVSPTFLLLPLLACGGGVTTGDSTADDTVDSALVAANGENLNGENLNGENLNGENLNGLALGSTIVAVNLAGATLPHGARVSLSLEGTALVARRANGRAAPAWALR